MRLTKKAAFGALIAPAAMVGVAFATPTFHSVQPRSYDPAHTFLVNSDWNQGLGCPTNAGISADGQTITDTYSDSACAAGGDQRDNRNQGLILAKTGPTGNWAAASADLKDVKGTPLTEIGIDVRKAGGMDSPNGSHCGAGALRFIISTQDGHSYTVGCGSNATPPDSETDGESWMRLRWGTPGTLNAQEVGNYDGPPVNISGKTVSSISILFDEGSDSGPDFFGVAIVDNIDVNGVLVSQGPNGN